MAEVTAGPPSLPEVLTDATDEEVHRRRELIKEGGPAHRRRAHEESGKKFVRDRLDLLLDEGSFVEEWILARSRATVTSRRMPSSPVSARSPVAPWR